MTSGKGVECRRIRGFDATSLRPRVGICSCKVDSPRGATKRVRRAQKADVERDSIRLLFTGIDYDTFMGWFSLSLGECLWVLVFASPI